MVDLFGGASNSMDILCPSERSPLIQKLAIANQEDCHFKFLNRIRGVNNMSNLEFKVQVLVFFMRSQLCWLL